MNADGITPQDAVAANTAAIRGVQFPQNVTTPAATGAGNYDDVLTEVFERMDSRISRLESRETCEFASHVAAFCLGFGLALGLCIFQQGVGLRTAQQPLRNQRFNDDLNSNPGRRSISSGVHQFHLLPALYPA